MSKKSANSKLGAPVKLKNGRPFGIRLSGAQKDKLETVARKKGKTFSDLVRDAIKSVYGID